MDGERRVLAGQWARNVGIVSPCSRVCPQVVIPSLETVDYSGVIAEVPRSINVIDIRLERPNVPVTEIGACEDHLVLSSEQHHLHMHKRLTGFETHRYTCISEPIKQGLVPWEFQVCSWLNRDANRHTGLMSPDDGVRKRRKLNHVKSHIDAGVFSIDEVEHGLVAVFERGIAKTFLRRGGLRA